MSEIDKEITPIINEIVEDQEDSLDAEISLLESTLTESKNDENSDKTVVDFEQADTCKEQDRACSEIISDVIQSSVNQMKPVNSHNMLLDGEKNLNASTNAPATQVSSPQDYKNQCRHEDNEDSKIIDENIDNASQINNKSVFCSTPNTLKDGQDNFFPKDFDPERDLGQITPLKRKSLEDNQTNIKRMCHQLESIAEVDENCTDSSVGLDKKVNADAAQNDKDTVCPDSVKSELSALIPCFEVPAKSILKKWQPSCLTRSSTSSYLVLDECGESDVTDVEEITSSQPPQEGESPIDDFEFACNSLDELVKSSYENSQMDNDKFDELLQKLSQTYDLDDKTSVTLKTMEESMLTESDTTELVKTTPEVDKDSKGDDMKNLVVTIKTDDCTSNVRKIIEKNLITVKPPDDVRPPSSEDLAIDIPSTSKTLVTNEQNTHKEDEGAKPIDDEDFLLEEDHTSNKKPYEFFEFVSSNPQENEDNYNPDWQKLGKLTSDEERYKAVRDRWRSLIPPDPNRDLTCRQWRKKNNLPPLRIAPANNNHHIDSSGERTQLCTAVFQNKIRRLVQEVENQSLRVNQKMNNAFDQLGCEQDAEQRTLILRGGNGIQLAMLHRRHIEECRSLKNYYAQELERVIAPKKREIRILKEASEEVMLFQKFYRGVGSVDDQVCMYMSDVEVQELMETEEMLEHYTRYYR